METKPDCYECKHRGDVPGSCHSSCKHPSFGSAHDDPGLRLMAMFASVRRMPPIQAKADGITVTGNPHGIRSGWFNHPFDFDPVWLKECTGFEAKNTGTQP